MVRRRWIIYLATGTVFGAIDFFYLEFLNRFPGDQFLFISGPTGWMLKFLVLNLGLWLVPVVPVALYEARLSRSMLQPAVASLFVWCVGIVAYYLTNAVQLAFLGVPGRPEMHISNHSYPHFWENWAFVLRVNILRGIAEWIMVAVVGGAIVGFLTGIVYLRFPTTENAERT